MEHVDRFVRHRCRRWRRRRRSLRRARPDRLGRVGPVRVRHERECVSDACVRHHEFNHGDEAIDAIPVISDVCVAEA